jgi:hypothetical protein
LNKGGKIAVSSEAYFLQRRKGGCKAIMKSEDYSGELKGNYARFDNREGRYHAELRPCVDEPKVQEKRQTGK